MVWAAFRPQAATPLAGHWDIHPLGIPMTRSELNARRQAHQLAQVSRLAREAAESLTRPLPPNLLREVVQTYDLQGLQEDLPWSRDFAPFFELPPNVLRITQHVFCELLNNAIDHSEGTQVTVSLRQTPAHVQLLVSDNGRGLFDKLSESFALDDPRLAMLELSKGKLTSLPEQHGGHGLFFVSRLADVFDLHANDEAFQRRDWEGDRWLIGRPLKRQGTSIYAAISLDTPRTLQSVLRAHSLDGVAFGFERTTIPLGLVASDEVAFDSRAQARRVATRMERFRHIDIDFDGIEEIGYSFADELFRVLPSQRPGVELRPYNMTLLVAAMVESVKSGL
jgi:anti-sigma regulatory factor (Ser/Thr protein kinase)